MNINANELFSSFDLNKTKYFRQKWKDSEAFFEDYNNKNEVDKIAFNAQLKSLFIINYKKEFRNKVVFSYKNYLFWFNFIYFLMNVVSLIFVVIAIIFIELYSKKYDIEYKYWIIGWTGTFFGIYLLGSFFPFIHNWKKLDKKEFFKVYGKGLKNYQFDFSNKEEIFNFIKNKKHPEKIKFNWTKEDFHYFSVLYSREADNQIIDITTNWFTFSNWRHHGYIGVFSGRIFSFITPIFRFWTLDIFKSKDFLDKEKEYYNNPKYNHVARERNIIFPIRLNQKTHKRFKVIIGSIWYLIFLIFVNFWVTALLLFFSFI